MFLIILSLSSYKLMDPSGEIKIEIVNEISGVNEFYLNPITIYDRLVINEIRNEGNFFIFEYFFKEEGEDIIEFQVLNKDHELIGNKMIEMIYNKEKRENKLNVIVEMDKMIIQFDGELSIDIFDITGRKIRRLKEIIKGEKVISLGEIRNGIYFYQIKWNKQVKKGKILILGGEK